MLIINTEIETKIKLFIMVLFRRFFCAILLCLLAASSNASPNIRSYINGTKTNEEILIFIGDITPDNNGLYTLKEMAFLFRKKGDHINEGICYDKIAWIFFLNDEMTLSATYLSKAGSIYKKEQYRYGLANIHLALGNFEEKNKNYSLSESHYKKAIALFRKELSKYSKTKTMVKSALAISYINLGDVLSILERYNEASRCYSLARKFTSESMLINDIEIAKIKIAFNSGNKIDALNRALHYSKSANAQSYPFSNYFMIASFYKENRKYDKALIYLDSALKYDQQSTKVLEMYMDIYVTLNNDTKALIYAQQLLKLERNKARKIQTTTALFKTHLKAEEFQYKYLESQRLKLEADLNSRNLLLTSTLMLLLILLTVYFLRKRLVRLKNDISRMRKSIFHYRYYTQKSLDKTKMEVREIEKIIGEKEQFSEKVLNVRDQLIIKNKIKEVYLNVSIPDMNEMDLKHELMSLFPMLTSPDIELFYLLLIGKSAEYISEYFAIEIESVYTKRHRLRKKIGIAKTQDLLVFVTQQLLEKAG